MGKRRRAQTVGLGTRLILLFVLEHGEPQHGQSIREEAERIVGRKFSIWPLHAVLRQLEGRGFVMSDLRKDPDLGNYRRYYWIAQAGQAALNDIRRVIKAAQERGTT